MGDHMPVHLGSMPCVRSSSASPRFELEPGDIALLNDPFAGGTHLPDLTHGHADLSAREPTSHPFMWPTARIMPMSAARTPDRWDLRAEIFQEGLRIPPVKLFRRVQ